MPFYLATQEFFELVRDRLAPGGLVALNVATVPGGRKLEEGLAGTLADGLPLVRTWPVLRFNHIVIGFGDDRAVQEGNHHDTSTSPCPSSSTCSSVTWTVDRTKAGPVDRRPRTGRVGDRPDDPHVRGRGRPLDEDLLPTAL